MAKPKLFQSPADIQQELDNKLNSLSFGELQLLLVKEQTVGEIKTAADCDRPVQAQTPRRHVGNSRTLDVH